MLSVRLPVLKSVQYGGGLGSFGGSFARSGLRLGPRPFASMPLFGSQVQTYNIKKVLNYSPISLYSVISDVEKYSEFLPFCEASTITARNKDGTPTRAVLRIGWEAFNESYESKLSFEDGKTVVAEAHDSSMFKTLYTRWHLGEIKTRSKPGVNGQSPTKCAVNFDLKFEFNNPLYNKILSGFGETLAQKMMDAFEKRTKEIERGL